MRAPAPPMETLAARSHIAPGTPVLPRAGMNRRSPNPISCAAQASADVGQGHPTCILPSSAVGRSPPLTRRPHPCRALVEAATHACTHRVYRERYQRTKARVGKQRGAKVAQVDLARRLAEAIWHMLSRNQPFAPAGATDPLAARRSRKEMRYRSELPSALSSHQEAIER
jgi:hypothetical protein